LLRFESYTKKERNPFSLNSELTLKGAKHKTPTGDVFNWRLEGLGKNVLGVLCLTQSFHVPCSSVGVGACVAVPVCWLFISENTALMTKPTIVTNRAAFAFPVVVK
jgi:hypothetical protein